MRGKFWVQKRADLVNEAEAILERAQVQGRELTPGEEQWFEKTKADIDFCAGRVAAHNEQRDAELTKMGMLPSRNGGQEQSDLLPESHRARLSHLQKTPGASGRRYGDLFPHAGDAGGFASGEEFLRIVASSMSDERILRLNADTNLESIPSAGGYTVPEILSRQWLDSALESEIVRPRARVLPMTSETLKIGGFDVSDLSTSLPAGLRTEWAEENSPAVPQVGKFRIIGLKAHKLRLYTEASNELVADGVDFESQFG
jgi:HK97 family phage major capsid protein